MIPSWIIYAVATFLVLYLLCGLLAWSIAIKFCGGKKVYMEMISTKRKCTNGMYWLIKIMFIFIWPLFVSRKESEDKE